MTGTFSVKGWTTFQHYRDRNPPWIRFYNTTLDNYEIGLLPDAAKAHLFAIWLLASRYNNQIPYDAAWVASKINATEKVDLNILEKHGLIELNHDCIKVLADCEQVGTQSRDRVETENINIPPLDSPQGEKRKRRTAIPTDWKPTEKDTAYAFDRGHSQDTLPDLANQFRDHHTAKQTLSADWAASWRTWVANDIRFNGAVAGRGAGRFRSTRNGSQSGSVVSAIARLRAQPDHADPVHPPWSGCGDHGLSDTPSIEQGSPLASVSDGGGIHGPGDESRVYGPPGRIKAIN